jgi:hypothetical protein
MYFSAGVIGEFHGDRFRNPGERGPRDPTGAKAVVRQSMKSKPVQETSQL